MKTARQYIIEREAVQKPENNKTRTYLYVRPISNGEACVEVWAARNRRRDNRLLTKSVYRFYTNSERYQVRDMVKMWFSMGQKLFVDFSESGYGRSYYSEMNRQDLKGKWDTDIHQFGEGYMPCYAPMLNDFTGTKYQYCAYDHNCGMTILDYIDLYKINPAAELFSKAKQFQFLTRAFLTTLSADADFSKWFRKHAKEICERHFGIKQVKTMYGKKLNMAEYLARLREQERIKAEAEMKELIKDANRHNRRIRKLYDAIKSICKRHGAFEVVVPKTGEDMVREGFAMHNCVGKCYASRQGDTAIVIFLHKDGQPCVDVEIDPKTFAIRQCRAVCNHDAEKNHWELARLVAAEIKNEYRKAA